MEGQIESAATITGAGQTSGVKKPVATLKLTVQYHADADAAQEHGKQMVEQLRAQGHTVKAEFVAHEPRKAQL